ncbi:MAG: alpha-2-macroglobulin family protein [Acidobacteriota bacterium]|nr:alpha-2-macroglobulin family protein [Acidobacteriota bacterium]
MFVQRHHRDLNRWKSRKRSGLTVRLATFLGVFFLVLLFLAATADEHFSSSLKYKGQNSAGQEHNVFTSPGQSFGAECSHSFLIKQLSYLSRQTKESGFPGYDVLTPDFLAVDFGSSLSSSINNETTSSAYTLVEKSSEDSFRTTSSGVNTKPDSSQELTGRKKIEQLIAEEKLQSAAGECAALRQEAQKANDPSLWTWALITEAQLRAAVGEIEKAVDLLMTEPWPASPLERDLLSLFYGKALADYYHANDWEINRRERLGGINRHSTDLSTWTKDEFSAEIWQAFLRAWKDRNRLAPAQVSDFPDFWEAGNYPSGVRDTLQDDLVYELNDFLINSRFWTPGQANGIWCLDLNRLLSSAGKTSGKEALRIITSSASHPIEKAVAILSEHENWCRRSGRLEASLEARFELVQSLYIFFEGEEHQAAIRRHLENYLASPANSRLPWWAMGQAKLAQWVMNEDLPDARFRAREIALKGAKRFPLSWGGNSCLQLVKSIERPEFWIETMRTDLPGRRSIRITHCNLEHLYFRAFAIDRESVLQKFMNSVPWDFSSRIKGKERAKILAARRPDASWVVNLEKRGDYRNHTTYSGLPADLKTGFYLIVASAREDFALDTNNIIGFLVSLSNLAVLARLNEEARVEEVMVLSGETGQPVSGATVELYGSDWNLGEESNFKKLDSRTTDNSGLARFELKEGTRLVYIQTVKKDEDFSLSSRQTFTIWESDDRETRSSLIYTDRSVYRPGQKILWKVLGYKGKTESGRISSEARANITVWLEDENREKVAQKTVVTNSFGTASGEFIIPAAGRPLGIWQLRSSLDGAAYIQVEEYKRPTFEVSINDPEKPLRLKRPAKLKLNARYYFGLPVSGGKVIWKVERQPVYLVRSWSSIRGRLEIETIAGGEGHLANDGTFELEFTPEAKESEEAKESGLFYSYRLSADITDEGGETRSAERSFNLGFIDVEARVKAANGFYLTGEKASFSISRTDLNGIPKPGRGTWRVVELVQPEKTLLPAEQPLSPEPGTVDPDFPPTTGDLQRPRWEKISPEEVLEQWAEGKEVAGGTAEHDAKGQAMAEVPGLSSGAYKFIYETKDDFGVTVRDDICFLVAGGDSGPQLKLPLVVKAEKPSIRVGETAHFLVSSGIEGQPIRFEFWSGNRLKESRWLTAGKDKIIIEVPVTEELRGGFSVRATALCDFQFMSEEASVFVPWDNKQLKLSFATFRDKLKPGEAETWKVKVESADNRPAEKGAAEVLAYMYDKSLDLLAAHHSPSVLALYPELTASNSWKIELENPDRVLEVSSADWGFRPDSEHLKEDKFFSLFRYGYPFRGFGALKKAGGRGVATSRGNEVIVEAEAPIFDAKSTIMAQARVSENFDEKKYKMKTEAEKAVELRSDFSETAFWQPHLLTGSDGSVTIEFTVPDSVTAWKVLVEAVTRELAAGSLEAEARSVKELMVRPYLPRFLREGDVAALQVMVQNSSRGELSGQVTLEVTDPQTDENLLTAFGLAPGSDRKPFTVKPGQGSVVTFPLKTPARPGTVAFKVVATAGNLSDGELRPLPILPGRMHLSQSRFVALKDEKPRQVAFEEMASDSDTTRLNEQLVITVDGQLFYSLLESLPYLINYPYECTEQTLNRFLATGILTSLYGQYPGVVRLAKELSKRETAYEAFDRSDPNRKMVLEETPWLEEARGGVRDKAGAGDQAGPDPELARVLNPQVAEAERKANLKKLLDAQLASGAFPWWPGGPESPYMTLYIVNGLSRAIEFGVEVPKEPVSKAIEYLHKHYIERLSLEMKEDKKDGESPGLIVFLNYVLTNFPDKSWTGEAFNQDERSRMLDYSFKHWRECSLYLRGLQALTLKRAGRVGDATLVWESVMDRARTTEEEGTSWMPEERSWLWYNDTVESQAFALRTLLELNPADSRAAGIVQWLFLNKKLNHWKSTRATAEVLYSVASYLKKMGALAGREMVTAEMCGQKTTFVFEPDRYTGQKNQVVISGEKLGPPCATVKFEKQGKALALASATWHFSTEQLPARSDSDLFGVERSYFRRVQKGKETVLQPIAQGAVLAVGDEIEVRLTIKSRHPAEYVHLRDPRPAGCEPVRLTSSWRYELGLPRYEEIRDSGTNFFIEWLPQGEYTLTYRLRCATAGTFKTGPAVLQSMYAPEFTAYSSGQLINIK